MLNLQTPEDRSAAAGEYVLGTLAPDEREAFERALGGDAALRAEVAHWQDRFLALSARVAPAEPSAGLWRRIVPTSWEVFPDAWESFTIYLGLGVPSIEHFVVQTQKDYCGRPGALDGPCAALP